MADETPTPGSTRRKPRRRSRTRPRAAASAERILNQEEIDSLLGFDVNRRPDAGQIRRPRHHQFGAGLL